MKIASSRPKRLEISKLIPTHNRLRDISRLKALRYSTFAPPSLSLIDDDYYIHDGHHRLVVMMWRNEKYISNFELYIADSNEYNEINFDVGYVTPFDITRECRLPEFYNFKKVIMDMMNYHSRTTIRTKIRQNHHYYAEDRYVYDMQDLFVNSRFAL